MIYLFISQFLIQNQNLSYKISIQSNYNKIIKINMKKIFLNHSISIRYNYLFIDQNAKKII